MMQHANKMILEPHNISNVMDRDKSATNKLLNSLDLEMKKNLDDDNMAMDTKIIQYNQVLHRFQKFEYDSAKPMELEIRCGENENKNNKENEKILRMIHSVVPNRFKKNAALLLDYAVDNPRVTWSAKDELIIDGNKIMGSNIVDVITYLSVPRKVQPPLGSDALIHVLLNRNISTEIIVNKQRLKNLSDVYLANDYNKIVSPVDSNFMSFETPRRSPKKRKQKGGGLVWVSY